MSRLENGPPVGFPVQFRVSGEDIPTVRRIARDVAAVMRVDADASNVQFDWDEPSKVIRVAIDQNKARVLGISSQDLATFLNNSLSGSRSPISANATSRSRFCCAAPRRSARKSASSRTWRSLRAMGARADHADRRHPL
jgi:multidrug efflux pump subunit AcrB